MGKIILIRHGESQNNVRAYSKNMDFPSTKSEDPLLSVKGRVQAELAGEYLSKKGLKIPYILCSPLKRTVETASLISSFVKCPIELNSNLYEIGGLFKGDVIFKGAKKSWFNENYPNVITNDKGITEEGWYLEKKAESLEEGRERTMKILDIIKERANKLQNDETLIVVTHGGILHFICNILTKQKKDSSKYFIHENCGFLELEFSNEQFNINYINFYGHLKNPHKNIDFTTKFADLIKPYDLFEIIFKKKK